MAFQPNILLTMNILNIENKLSILIQIMAIFFVA